MITSDKIVPLCLVVSLVIFIVSCVLTCFRYLLSKKMGKNIFNFKDTQKCEEAKIKAIEANRAKSIFLANMSHEIRTSLTEIIGFTELLKDTKLEKGQKEFLEIIEKSSNNLLKISNNILDLSKIQNNKLEIEEIEFNPINAFVYAIELYKPKANQKNINLAYYIDPSLNHNLKGDPTKINQVLINLLSNALKFTNNFGSISVTILKQKSLKVGYTKVRFEVKDNGIGITNEQKSNIFQPFSQAESSISRKYGGTGLGLTISNRLIELMSAKLDMTSELNKGTTFFFELEFKNHFTPHKLSGQQKFLDSKFNAKVLIAEDNVINQKLMTRMFEDIGLDVTVVSNGLEAFQKRKESNFNLIFMDIQMPCLNGLEATKKILEYEEIHKKIHIPIIALSANALKEDSQRTLNAGVDRYMTKPLIKSELIETLNKYLEV